MSDDDSCESLSQTAHAHAKPEHVTPLTQEVAAIHSLTRRNGKVALCSPAGATSTHV